MTNTTTSTPLQIRVQPTPNPNAWKFILDRPILNEGKATFNTPAEAFGNRMAIDLLGLDGVKQIHFFQNVVTVTGRLDCDPESLEAAVISVLQTRIAIHDPNWSSEESKKAKRGDLAPELQKIEEILDRTIRPGLQGDGGDVEIVRLDNQKLYVHYQGACGTCPSSTSGTLMAIEGILRDELQTEIEVIPV